MSPVVPLWIKLIGFVKLRSELFSREWLIITNSPSSSIPRGCGGITNPSTIPPNSRFDNTSFRIEKLATATGGQTKGTYGGLPDLRNKILCAALWNTVNGSGSLLAKFYEAALIVDE